MTTRLTLGTDALGEVEGFIFAMVRWGEHHHTATRTWSREQMRASIPDYAQVLEDVRQGYPVKYFENLLGATWHVGSSSEADGAVAIHNPYTGEEQTLAGVGILESPTYAAMFETAVAAWHRA